MSKPVKLSLKIALDVVMCVLLIFLYKAKVLTLTYHEVVGVGILLIFLVHCIFNRKWIATNTKKLFDRSIPARTRFSYWVTVLLVVCFLLIVLSGVVISKILFKEFIAGLNLDDTSVFRTIHLFCSALSLILVGIHLGLYWNMVKGFFAKRIHIAAKVAKPLSRVLLAVVLVVGIYSIPMSSFGSWLICPVVPISHSHSHGDSDATEEAADGTADEEGDAVSEDDGADAADGSDQDGDATEAAGSHALAEDAAGTAESGSDAAAETGEDGGSDEADGRGGADAEASGADDASSGDGSSSGSGNHGNNVTPGGIAQCLVYFASIIGLFAEITYWIDERLKRRRRAKKEARS